MGDRSDRPTVEIERFRREDQAAVEQLIIDGLVEHWGVLDPQLNPDLDDIEANYAGGTVLVARHNGRIVGAGAIVPVSADECEVKRMSVARDMRRQGVGTALFRELAAEAHRRGWRQLVLETTADWEDAVQFYGALGLELTHYEDGTFTRDAFFKMDLSAEDEVHAAVLAQFSSRSFAAREQAVATARAQPFADALLAEMLDRAEPGYVGSGIAASLGDLRGDAGTAALRRAVVAVGPGTRDVRCAALLALAKRCGEDATPWLRDALQVADRQVKEYAVLGLAGVGNDLAWEEVATYLSNLARKTAREFPSPLPTAVAYLGQHVQHDDERRSRLVTLVRTHWSRRTAEERQWFNEQWPAATPGGPEVEDVEPPDADAFRRWARSNGLFEPIAK